MGSTAVVTLLLLLYFKISNQLAVENTDDVLKYLEEPLNIQKRETSSKHEYFNYIKQKLTEHSQALEQLVMFGLKHENLIEKLVEYLIKDIEEPKLPEKLENSRRFLNQDTEKEIDEVSRTHQENKNSSWCSVAIMCSKTFKPVCGLDDNFGFGKFEDICHMLRVNCYWKYNFTIAPHCSPNS